MGTIAANILVGGFVLTVIFVFWFVLAVIITQLHNGYTELRKAGVVGRAIFKKLEQNDSLKDPVDPDLEIYPSELL